MPSRWPAKVEELRAMGRGRADGVSLAAYLEGTGVELEDVYAGGKSWSDLREDAGLPVSSGLRVSSDGTIAQSSMVRITPLPHACSQLRSPYF